MLDLRVKASAIGIRDADFPSTLIVDIILGWEGERLRLYHQSMPVLDAQLAELSAVQLGKAKRERDKTANDLTSEEIKKRREEEADRLRGEPELERIRRLAYFRLMPQHMQADEVRRHGWPTDDGKAMVIEGLEKSLAAELIALSQSGELPDSLLGKPAFRTLRARLFATASVK